MTTKKVAGTKKLKMGKTLAELFFKYRSNHRIIENMFLASKRCLGLARVPHSLSSFAFLLLILYLLWKFFAQILIFLSFWHCYIKGRKNFVGKSQLIKYFTQPYVDLLLCTNGHPLFPTVWTHHAYTQKV